MKLVAYKEQMNIDELSFVEKTEQRERKQFFKMARIVLAICFICPFIVAWWKAIGGAPDPFSYVQYFGGVFFLICFSGFIMFMGYRNSLLKLQNDLRNQTKTIEQTSINRKQYMMQNNAYYFYLDSPNKLSIEVQEADYRRLDKGDELNIEYASYSKLYLGYF